MGKGIERLTVRAVEAKSKPGVYADGAGLYLRVVKNVGRDGAESISKSWVFRYMTDGRAHNMGLGPVHTITLAEARERARQYRKDKLDGFDPIARRRVAVSSNRLTEAKAVPTFAEAAEEYIKRKEEGWRDRTEGANWRQMLTAHAGLLMPLPVDQINVPLVLRVVEPLWSDRPRLANKLRARVAAVLASATVRGYRQGDNPAAWRDHLQHSGLETPERLAETIAHKALPYQDVPAAIGELQSGDDMVSRAAEFLILTGSRVGEVVQTQRNIGMRWPEVDFETATWVIPKERMKGGVQHRVPLSERAVAILREAEAWRTDDRVFAMSYTTLRRRLKPLCQGHDLHGFRSSFRDWCSVNRVDHDVAEKSIAHYEGSRTVKAYNRDDLLELRRPVMERWARHCCGETTSDNIVPLRA